MATSWNYRVVKTISSKGSWPSFYSVHDVYYESGTPSSINQNESSPFGPTRESFSRSVVAFSKALVKPVLIFDWDTDKFVGEEPPLVEKRGA